MRYLLALSLACVCSGLALPSAAAGAEYYVSFDSPCSDANLGTSRDQPWCSLPGTRVKSNGGFGGNGGRWGNISTSNRIAAGDTIWIKAGTTWAQADQGGTGGRILLGTTTVGGPSYYGSGTSTNPIRIRSGAAHASPWGSGDVVIDCAGMTLASYEACVYLFNGDSAQIGSWLHILGKDASNRIRVTNSADTGVNLVGYDASPKLQGLLLDWFTIDRSGGFGINVGWADGVTLRNGLVYGNQSSGVVFGSANAEVVTNGTAVDVESYQNGSGTGLEHGFNVFDCGTPDAPILFLRTKAHGNVRDGYDIGNVDDAAGLTTVLLFDVQSWDNREDGIACNGCDGSSCGGGTTCSTIGAVLFQNVNSAVCTYAQRVRNSVSNSVLIRNGSGASGGAGCFGMGRDVSGGDAGTFLSVRNVICYQPDGADVRAFTACGGGFTGAPTRASQSSIYVPYALDSETFVSGVTYDGSPAGQFSSFVGNLLGRVNPNYDSPALFTAVNATTFVTLDLRPSSASARSVDAGTPYCQVTSPSGSGSSFAVNCDPRLHFYLSQGRPGVAADEAYIGAGTSARCTVTGLSGSQITCASPVSWTQNAPVARRPVSGTAIDIGVSEFGSPTTTTLPGATTTTLATTSTTLPSTTTTQPPTTTTLPSTTTTQPTTVPTTTTTTVPGPPAAPRLLSVEPIS